MLFAGRTPFTGSGGLSTEVISIGLQSPAAAQHR